ncbi:carbon-nitrogen hydrolase family protein [Campylobacter sp. faydin G-24]|uniref:Carbon-nitrogen hydrolase family protein n=1 Tax=Campylobacter anatolicus TaxID=2829105 RepID=A0ABS5HKK1_9BACT|nr:carbon-nitrogen hydrolase family protein [Campylobacter anatolicus]MBR8461291.1 carbon-nitrogen hydrolase family protein [Campylobacter anatolicus]MBR8464525.1 carbon-nitrogen hydrolase family protein [Campylobacter anatolicus]MBR8466262.1 carbon-nitrogen hydrolase family protein [Campylobacter anatolicus]
MTTSDLFLYPIIVSGKNATKRQENLLSQIVAAPANSLILASELCISGYDFDSAFTGVNATMMDDALYRFDAILLEQIANTLERDKFLAFTHLNSVKDEKSLTKMYNEFILISKAGVLYSQRKSKLFLPNKEQEKFSVGEENKINFFEFKGLKLGVLICFELRFTELWARLKGCDVVLVPAMWGRERADAYHSLCKALAIANNCYVAFSSSLDLEVSGVFLPNGKLTQNTKFDSKMINLVKQDLGL